MCPPTLHRTLLLVALAAVCVMIGCDTAGDQAGSAGASAILDPDNPELTAEHVFVTVDRVLGLHAELGWVELSADEQEVDLLTLKDDLFGGLGLADVPAGTLRRVYLRTTSATLVLSDGSEATVTIPATRDVMCHARRDHRRGWRLLRRLINRLPARFRDRLLQRLWCRFGVGDGCIRILGDIVVPEGGFADVQLAFNAPRDLTKQDDGSYEMNPVIHVAHAEAVGHDGAIVGHEQADVDGDGAGDLVLFGRNGDNPALLLYLNDEGALAGDPSVETVLTDITGRGVSNALHLGDVNGDGFTDIAEAQVCDDLGVRVHLGSADGFSATPFQSFSDAGGNHYGHDLASGDVNGDGRNDLVIASCGAVHVHHGVEDGGFSTDADATLTGDNGFGAHVALSDVNGDGHDDLLVGSCRAVSLYYGSADGFGDTADATLSEGDAFSRGGIVGGEDFNGDGFEDVAVGAPSRRHPAVYVYHGSENGLDTVAATVLEGGRCSGFGSTIASTRDFTGDGYADLIVSETRGRFGASHTHVYAGGMAGVGSEPFASVNNPPSACYLRVRGLGDINGDGATDLALCGIDHRHEAVWVYHGGLGGHRSYADQCFKGTTPGGSNIHAHDVAAYNPTARGFTPEPEPQGTDARGFAVEFPGGRDGTHLASTAATDPPAPTMRTMFSWAGWVYVNTTSGRQTISRHWYEVTQGGWIFELNNGRPRVLSNSGQTRAQALTGVPGNTWMFLGFSWNSGTITFVQGVPGSPLSVESVSLIGYNYPAIQEQSRYGLGGNSAPGIGELSGRLAECGYWNQTLTASDLDTLYNNGLGMRYTDLPAALTANLLCYHGLQDAGGGAVDEHTGGHDLVPTTGDQGALTFQVAGPGAR